ncbi:DUF6240 domain-containing protein [Candidatus Galacturonibacter soehngenii]|uniref:Flagellar hook-length control protein FliK n=1 Tax=Candidatus Galacturonatibacter soehngenii TaxID=2307010 RepID=A0A7V7QL42_9FIRM|nr:DUF6240 domain-containing protein [Candidatus Galacturonibacter soehngenii]KAB1438644.1 hypothetical protein F7O84_14040 [Candidatus Galacturonibacter soehngenii]
MNVNNKVDLNSIHNKLEFSEKQKNIDSVTQKLFSQDAFKVESSDSKNQLFKMGENAQEDIMQAAQTQPSEFVKSTLAALGKTVTSNDLSELDKEGFDVTEDEVKTIVTVTDKIQIYLATHCEDYQITGDISKEAIEKVAGSSQLAMEISKKLMESNLPITKDNIEDIEEALEIANQLQPISDGALKYLIHNKLAPSIENIYKAEFSGLNSAGGTYAAGFFSEGTGYVGKISDDFNWDSLKESMSKVIESANLKVDNETLSDAKWLMENHIPLTKDTLSQYESLKDVTLPLSQEDVLNQIMQAIQEGKKPVQALVTNEPSFVERAQEAYQVIQETTAQDIKEVIANELPVTISNLKDVQAKQTEDTSEKANSKALEVIENNITYITARRQLEEIRLQMSVEANYRLLKQGISIETSSLQALITELKNAENLYYKQLLDSSDIEASTQNISTLKDITTKLSEIRYVPSDVIGKVVSGETPNSIQGIHKTGSELKSKYDAANQSYEALMTKPRSDMGDHIAKAFQNVDDILTDLGLEITNSNQRAVRILGYNNMEINLENINAVKVADAAVNQTISSLTPKVVLNMIREGINPLDTDVNELNNQIKDMNHLLGDDNSQEKYSEFLWRLEKNSEISSKERDAFVGMYRLLHNVEKTDGQVIGALVNQNAEITLNNLLTGVRTIKNKGLDVKVDDNFGGLESLHFTTTSISEQLSSAFPSQTNMGQEQANNQSGETQYYNNLLDKALREITPDKLEQVFEDGEIKDMSLEKFVDELSNAKENKLISEEYYKEQQEVIQKASQVEKNVITMLSDFRQPITIHNILAADALMNKRGSMFQKLTEQSKENDKLSDAFTQITDALESKEEMQQAYENLEKVAMSSLDEKVKEQDVTSLDLKELKLLRNEIKLTTHLSKEEKYEIPIQIGEEITSINLTVIRGTQSGKVSITMENETVGKAVAEFVLKDKEAYGYIASDNQSGLNILKSNGNVLKNQLEASGISLGKLDFIASKNLDMNQIKHDIEPSEIENQANTKDLYRLAKAFVISIQNQQTKTN